MIVTLYRIIRGFAAGRSQVGDLPSYRPFKDRGERLTASLKSLLLRIIIIIMKIRIRIVIILILLLLLRIIVIIIKIVHPGLERWVRHQDSAHLL